MVRVIDAFSSQSAMGSNQSLSSAPLKDARAVQAKRLSCQYQNHDASSVLTAAIRHEFAGRIALVSSFGAESSVLLHMVSAIDPATPVIFLDTGKHFAQTLAYQRSLTQRLGLSDVRVVAPSSEAILLGDPEGDLHKRDPDACCALRKVRPLSGVLDGFDAWITGRKQFQGPTRANLPAFEASKTHVKVNPLISWSPEDVASYAARYQLPPHPLVAQGFTSIGCWPCTSATDGSDHARSGRWRGADKTECGIHTFG